tara:strand:- start:3353 stop:4447 length:1095 start_codon:yes stop_codon:yes gene_type:complete
MKIAIIGGGINGLFTAWKIAENDIDVDLFEADAVLSKTSSASSKLLHGGIRYLEQGHINLVRESLIDRDWWLKNAPQYAKKINMCMPVYSNNKRSKLVLYAGACLYNFLAGKYSLGPTKWHSKQNTINRFPEISYKNLKGSVTFFDAQMNESKLGNWVRCNAEKSGVKIHENHEVNKVKTNAEITIKNKNIKYDYVINTSGPWASELLRRSKIDSQFNLTMIRGSHLLINYELSSSYILQEPIGKRIIFVMPYLGQTLIGTTEIKQSLNEPVECSIAEREYLINIFNTYFTKTIKIEDIESEYSGIRPIVSKKIMSGNYSSASREFEMETIDRLINIYGGKWTSAPSLSSKVFAEVRRLRGLHD